MRIAIDLRRFTWLFRFGSFQFNQNRVWCVVMSVPSSLVALPIWFPSIYSSKQKSQTTHNRPEEIRKRIKLRLHLKRKIVHLNSHSNGKKIKRRNVFCWTFELLRSIWVQTKNHFDRLAFVQSYSHERIGRHFTIKTMCDIADRQPIDLLFLFQFFRVYSPFARCVDSNAIENNSDRISAPMSWITMRNEKRQKTKIICLSFCFFFSVQTFSIFEFGWIDFILVL